MEVVCRCGYTTRGPEREVMSDIRAHARAEHQVVLTTADVRAMWRLVEETADGPDGAAR